MNDRQAVTQLMQYLSDKLLTSSDAFAQTLRHFDIQTTYEGIMGDPEFAGFANWKGFFFVDVFSAAHPKGQRFEFDTAEEAKAFASRIRHGEVA